MSEELYRGWDDEQVTRDADAVAGDDGFFKMDSRDENYVVRFLPARPDEPSAVLVLWQHYIEFSDGTKFVFNCPKLMSNQNGGPKLVCDGCLTVEQLLDSGNPADEKMAKKFSPKVRVMTRLIDRENEHKGPRIFAFGKMIFDELKLLRRNPRNGGDFTLPTEKGYDIEFFVQGQGLNKEYKTYAGQRGPLASDDQVREWLESMPSLNRFAKILSREEIQRGLRLSAGPVQPQPARSAQPTAPRLAQQTSNRVLESRPVRPRRDDDPVF